MIWYTLTCLYDFMLTNQYIIYIARDLVIKKMVYLFLCNYAETHPDLAQMCTNTLVKDSGNEDPMVRGLALRALCSLRLPQMIEYTSEPLRRSLQDGHAYVRKTGVMGILKMYHLNKEEFDKAAFNDILYDMLRDPDSSVVTNCILVLNEIMADSGGMALNRAVMLHLLNRIHEFSEFGILSVLDLVPRYIPANDEGKLACTCIALFVSHNGATSYESMHFHCRGIPNHELVRSSVEDCQFRSCCGNHSCLLIHCRCYWKTPGG